MDRIVTGITEDGGAVCYAIDSTDIVRQAEHNFKPSAVVTAALGRLLTAASLMGNQLKESDQSITLHVQGDGPIAALVAVSDADGNVRGYAAHNIVEIPPKAPSKLDVGAAVGKGTLKVLKDLGALVKEPITGSVPLVSGEIAEDITAYFAYSEQIPTVCALGVLVDADLSVITAGGFIAQLLPGADEACISQLEKNIEHLDSITNLYTSGKTPEDLIEMVLAGMDPKVLTTKEVEYRCNCSHDRVERALLSLGEAELLKIAEEEESITVDCHFCPKLYRFNAEELKALAKQSSSKRNKE